MAARFVVGPASACTAKGLLSNHGSSGLVVDVEVSSAVAKRRNGRLNVSTVLGKDGSRQGVLRGGITEFQRRFEVVVFVDVN